MSAAATFFRLETAEALRSRWVAFTAATYALVFGGFVWLGLRESSVLGFTGLTRVVLNVSNAVVVVLPLVALVATSQTIVRGRSSGFFELLLTQPCRRDAWLVGALGARIAVLVGPLVVLLVGCLAYGALGHDVALVGHVGRALGVTVALVWAFVGVGFFVSAIAPTAERATVYALLVWLGVAALHDLALVGVLLAWRLPPGLAFGLAAMNPVEAARLAILSGVDPELSVLGPVGFWLANTLGPRLTLGFGLAWPALVGAAALACAARRLRRMDLVG